MWVFLVAQMVKNFLPAVWETWVRSLGQEDLLEKGWQLTPLFLPGEFHGQRDLQSMESQRVGQQLSDERLHVPPCEHDILHLLL